MCSPSTRLSVSPAPQEHLRPEVPRGSLSGYIISSTPATGSFHLTPKRWRPLQPPAVVVCGGDPLLLYDDTVPGAQWRLSSFWRFSAADFSPSVPQESSYSPCLLLSFRGQNRQVLALSSHLGSLKNPLLLKRPADWLMLLFPANGGKGLLLSFKQICLFLQSTNLKLKVLLFI